MLNSLVITRNIQTSGSGCVSIKLYLQKEIIGQIRPAGHRVRIYTNSKSAKNNIRNSGKKSNTGMSIIRKSQKKIRWSKFDL